MLVSGVRHMIRQSNVLQNGHHKSSNHLSPYKIITVLSTVFFMLYITSPWLTYFITVSFYLLIPFTYFAQVSFPSDNHLFALCICKSVSFFFFNFLAAWRVRSYFSNQGSNPCPLHWKHRVLTTGPPGKSLFPFFLFVYKFIYLFILFFGCIGSSSLRVGFFQLHWAGATLRCGAWASHCGGLSCRGAQTLGVRASAVVAHGPSRSAARGIFPDQGSNPCPLHWQADS